VLRVAWWLAVAWAAAYAVGAFWYGFDLPDLGEIGDELVFYTVLFTVVAAYVRNRLGDPWKELVPLRRVDPLLGIPIVLVAVGGWLLSVQLMSLCEVLNVLPPEVFDLAGGSANAVDPERPLGESLVADAVLPGFFEEALMRGLVLQALLTMMSKRRAVAVSALLFASIHFRIERMPDIILGGLIYGWMAVRTGSLLPSMLAHALNNSLCVLVARGFMLEDLQSGVDGYGLLPAAWVWVAITIMLIGLVALRRDTAPPRRALPAPDWLGGGEAPAARLVPIPVARLRLR